MRYRISVAALCAGFAGLSAIPLVAGGDEPGERLGLFTSLRAKSASVDDLEVRGTIRIVDENGRQLAVLGREGGDGPMVLGFFAPDGSEEQTVRVAASGSGSAITLVAPGQEQEMTLTAAKFGTEIQIRQGEHSRVISDPRPPVRLAAVGAASERKSGPHGVSLVSPEIQDIGHGFMVAKLEAVDREGGLGIHGRVINTTSVRHTELRFRVSVNGSSEEFGIVMISPGNSTGFSVTLPGVSSADAGAAEIEYLVSKVGYSAYHDRPYTGLQSNSR